MKKSIALLSIVLLLSVSFVGASDILTDIWETSSTVASHFFGWLNGKIKVNNLLSGNVVGNTCAADADCGQGESCKDGVCSVAASAPAETPVVTPTPTPTCVDSDGGKNPDVVGSTTYITDGTTYSYADTCSGASTVNERYCEDNRDRDENINCGQGKVCQQGACVQSAQPTCIDTDNGQDFKTAGTVKYLNTANGQMETASDSCSGGNNLQEWYCDGGNVKYVGYQCSPNEACRNGACVDASVKGACTSHKECAYPNEACVKGTCMAISSLCSETDGGNVDNVKGTLTYIHDVTGEKVTVTDTCIHKTMLNEYACKVYWAKGKKGREYLMLFDNPAVDCATKGGYCSDGICVYTPGSKSAEGGMCATDDHCQQGLKCNRNAGVCESVKAKERERCEKESDCETGLKCDSYLCQKVTCVDSDGGKNDVSSLGKLTITTTRMGSYEIPDECVVLDNGMVMEEMVIEYSCNLDNFVYLEKVPSYCPPRSKCDKGVCGPQAPEIRYSCKDDESPSGDWMPDDVAVSRAGTIDYVDETGQHAQTDICADKKTVKEFSCEYLISKKEKLIACSDGYMCKDGACVAKPVPTCNDPDAIGDDIIELRQRYTVGTVTYVNDDGEHKISDSCSGGTFLNEMLCTGTTKTEIQIDCKGKCVNGACEKSPEACTDPDGQDVTKKTAVNFVNRNGVKGFNYDTCGVNNQVNEVICTGNLPSSKLIPCPTGTKCTGGYCMKTAQPAPQPKPVYTPPPPRRRKWWGRW